MDLNHVTLTGVLERDPITRFADHGTQQVSFTLRLTEAGPAGQAFTTYVLEMEAVHINTVGNVHL
jgi:hypothetical protein